MDDLLRREIRVLASHERDSPRHDSGGVGGASALAVEALVAGAVDVHAGRGDRHLLASHRDIRVVALAIHRPNSEHPVIRRREGYSLNCRPITYAGDNDYIRLNGVLN
jgi:hypothetical protein